MTTIHQGTFVSKSILGTRLLTLQAHTDRTRFGNATRILDFQCRLTLILFQTSGNILAIEAIWSAYLENNEKIAWRCIIAFGLRGPYLGLLNLAVVSRGRWYTRNEVANRCIIWYISKLLFLRGWYKS